MATLTLTPAKLGEYLRNNYDAKALAQAGGLTTQQVYNILNGKHRVPAKLLQALGIEVVYQVSA